MKYYTLHIKDSGAIEDYDEKIINGQKTHICKIYDDVEFNSLNDILHTTDEYVVNEKTLKLFQKSNIIPYDLFPAIVKRKEKILGPIKTTKSYEYFKVSLLEPKDLVCYNWINFNKSEIKVLKDGIEVCNLSSHEELFIYIEENKKISKQINEIHSLKISDKEKREKTKNLKTFFFETKSITFNNNFDSSIDMFKIPFYSWGTYVSERFMNLLLENKISDIGFAVSQKELGNVWKPYFPIIKFE
ncbi:hypothetical protein [Flavobacterium terrae]|uniref:Uncharacterized protein n=1 Tax=Flavobacterium terrae TaxID=415425 RepID=A0A1M6EEC0_9FLAO|nr:hypothetical protein [Flavobacterium terrae]SHI83660.1 hypothetical protein SAMN05444363_1728 [Flavobacterium terrae]